MTSKVFRKKPLRATTVSRSTMAIPPAKSREQAGHPRSGSGSPETNGQASAASSGFPVGPPRRNLKSDDLLIELDLIRSSPWQQRGEESAEELRGLADSLLAHGLIQAVVVRPVPDSLGGSYELLAGHRRLAAARLAGWSEIRASIQEATDDQAREIVLLENLQRKDLNAIEEAHGFEQILNAAGGPTQVELAKRLGVTQGHISNRLRLLKLPAALKDYVISGEMSPSTARDLVAVADVPAVTEGIIKAYKAAKKFRKTVTMAELLEDKYNGFGRIIEETTRPVDRSTEYVRELGRSVPAFTPTPQQRAELDIREFDVRFGKPGTKEPRACNAKLWDELQKAHFAALVAKEGKKKGKAPAATGGKPLTAAQQKAAAEEEKRKRAERRGQLARRRKTIAVDRLRYLISRRVQEATGETEILLELLLKAATNGWASSYSARHVDKALAEFKAAPVATRSTVFLDEIFWNSIEDCPSQIVWENKVREVAEFLGIDLAAAWAADQMGPLTEAWWNAHDREELELIAFNHGFTPEPKQPPKKGQLVKWFLNRPIGTLPVPAELAGKKGKRNTEGTKAACKEKECRSHTHIAGRYRSDWRKGSL